MKNDNMKFGILFGALGVLLIFVVGITVPAVTGQFSFVNLWKKDKISAPIYSDSSYGGGDEIEEEVDLGKIKEACFQKTLAEGGVYYIGENSFELLTIRGGFSDSADNSILLDNKFTKEFRNKGKIYFMDSTIKVLAISSDKVVLEIDGVQKTLSEGSTYNSGNIEVYVDTINGGFTDPANNSIVMILSQEFELENHHSIYFDSGKNVKLLAVSSTKAVFSFCGF